MISLKFELNFLLKGSRCGLLNKGLSLATALFVTKFIEKIAKNFDTL
jgi:hypothetical protein